MRKFCRTWSGSRSRAGRVTLAVVWIALSAGAADAQVPDMPTTPRFRLGPFYLDPGLTLRDVGIDNNVFNEPGDRKRDFTATIAPFVDMGLQFRSTRLATATTIEYVYFDRYRSERSTNRRNTVALEFNFQRLGMYAAAEDVDTRSRPNAEIDARARRSEPTYYAGGHLKMGARTTLVLAAKRNTLNFAASELFRGVNLAQGLNRTSDSATATLRFELTPITTVVFITEAQRNQFDQARFRDADTVRVVAGFDFVPEGIINGRANVGYRDFDARGTGVPSYRGVVAQGDIGYAVFEGTRLGFHIERDVSYSFEPEHPYYVASGGGLRLTQRLFGPVDLIAGANRTEFAYRTFVGAFDRGRKDTFDLAGGALSVRVRTTGRFGVNVEFARRQSSLPDRSYETVRIFGSFSYGTKSP